MVKVNIQVLVVFFVGLSSLSCSKYCYKKEFLQAVIQEDYSPEQALLSTTGASTIEVFRKEDVTLTNIIQK